MREYRCCTRPDISVARIAHLRFVGKSFQADADENGFHITGEFFEWRVKWPAVRLKGEDERVFMFVAGGTVYIFGKKFLSSDQQQELRRISGLKS